MLAVPAAELELEGVVEGAARGLWEEAELPAGAAEPRVVEGVLVVRVEVGLEEGGEEVGELVEELGVAGVEAEEGLQVGVVGDGLRQRQGALDLGGRVAAVLDGPQLVDGAVGPPAEARLQRRREVHEAGAVVGARVDDDVVRLGDAHRDGAGAEADDLHQAAVGERLAQRLPGGAADEPGAEERQLRGEHQERRVQPARRLARRQQRLALLPFTR